MPASRKISASGDVVDDSSSSDESSLRSGGHVDVFGFNVDVRQLLVTLALAYLMLGSRGSKLCDSEYQCLQEEKNVFLFLTCVVTTVCCFESSLSTAAMALLIALGAYTVFMRVTRNSDSGGSSSRGGSSRSWGRRGGGGGGGAGGSHVRGVKDLPCDPKGG
jgi:uncharacterized membrane protein YgcG